MEAIRSSEMSVQTRATRCYIPEDDILHSHRSENLKSYNNSSILTHTKVIYCCHKSPPLVPMRKHVTVLYTSRSICLRSVLTLSSHLHLRLPSCLLFSDIPLNISYAFLVSPVQYTCYFPLLRCEYSLKRRLNPRPCLTEMDHILRS
jgi:hypothetical protein